MPGPVTARVLFAHLASTLAAHALRTVMLYTYVHSRKVGQSTSYVRENTRLTLIVLPLGSYEWHICYCTYKAKEESVLVLMRP